MKIIVCIKQIPDTNDVRWSKENNIIREGVISILNPLDLCALMSAREIENSEITLLSMGPENAIQSIRYGLCFCGNKGVLLSDKKFSGADTLATAKTLASAIKKLEYDLIITGQFAQDGDTAQTPYSLGTILNVPVIGYVTKIDKISEDEITVTSIKDDGIYKIKGKTPLVLAVSKYEGEIYKPLAFDYIRAQDSSVQIWGANEIDSSDVGIKGSPTYVSRAFRPQNKRECKFCDCSKLAEELK